MHYHPTENLAGKRLASGAIDYLFVFVFFFAYVYQFGQPNDTGGKTVTGLAALGPMVFWFCWLVLPEVLWGTTLGHRLNGLKIIAEHGEKPSFSQALRRRLCDGIEISWCFGLIAFILIKNTRHHQRLGDIWAKTLVVSNSYQPELMQFDFEQDPPVRY